MVCVERVVYFIPLDPRTYKYPTRSSEAGRCCLVEVEGEAGVDRCWFKGEVV